MSNVIPGPGYGPLEGAVENHGTQIIGSAGRPANSERRRCYIASDCIDIRDVELKLPDGVARCFACGGNGKYEQHYLEGRRTGGCDWCQTNGFVYEGEGHIRAVTASVTNQIAVANNLEFRNYGPAFGIDWRRAPERNESHDEH